MWSVAGKLLASQNGSSTQFKLDTEAEVTAISDNLCQPPPPTTPKNTLYGPSKWPLQSIGEFCGAISHKKHASRQPIFVLKDLKNLLGPPAITALQLGAQLDAAETDPTSDYSKIYPFLFKVLRNLGESIQIYLNSINTPRHVLLPLCERFKQELDWREHIGVITKSMNLVCRYGDIAKEGGKSQDMC